VNIDFRNLSAGFWVRLFGLGVVNGLALYSLPFLIDNENWLGLAAVILGVVGIDYIYLSGRTYPLRWLVPGLFFLAAMMLYPIIYTFYVALTNWSTGHILQKEQAIERLLEATFLPEQPEQFRVVIYQNEDDETDFRLLLERESGELFFGEPRLRGTPRPEEPELEDLTQLETTDEDGDGIPERVDGFVKLRLAEILRVAATVERFALDIPDVGTARMQTATQAGLEEILYSYDADRDVLTDRRAGTECVTDNDGGNFVCGGVAKDPGWTVVIGFQNFGDVLTENRIREPFIRVFSWNVIYAALSVALQFIVGLGLALAFNDERMKSRRIYRGFLILPWAIPAFISIIVWRGLLNRTFGPVNRLLEPLMDFLGRDAIPWLTDGFWAKFAVVLVNVWIGFPYFYLVTAGALQAIPASLQEAARVDGATSRRVFQRVTFPLLMVSIAPLLIASYGFNFNNFVNIFLLTEGGPPYVGYEVPVGQTDILISFTYNLAIATGRGQNFGLASAITFFIFLIVVAISAFSFRFTRRLEEVYGSL
jgi:ABC-type sugar transport system permease subunit